MLVSLVLSDSACQNSTVTCHKKCARSATDTSLCFFFPPKNEMNSFSPTCVCLLLCLSTPAEKSKNVSQLFASLRGKTSKNESRELLINTNTNTYTGGQRQEHNTTNRSKPGEQLVSQSDGTECIFTLVSSFGGNVAGVFEAVGSKADPHTTVLSEYESSRRWSLWSHHIQYHEGRKQTK